MYLFNIFYTCYICIFTHGFRYDFICVPLVHPLFKREFVSEPAKNRPGPFTRPDLILSSSGTQYNYIFLYYLYH